MKNKTPREQNHSIEEFVQDAVDLFNLFNKLLALVRDSLPSEPEIVPLMKYDDAIRYFVTDRPKDPKVKKGAMLRQRHRRGQQFVQMFLDKNNQMVCQPNGTPYGRKLVVKQFDEELCEAFDDQDLIIVE